MNIANSKRVFYGAIIGQTTTVGAATTYTGLCLANPPGSSYLIEVMAASWAFSVLWPALSVIGLMKGFSTTTAVVHTAAVTPVNAYGGAAGTGTLDSSATLPATPTVNKILGVGTTLAIASQQTASFFTSIEPGHITLPPGSFVAFYTSTASGTNGGNFCLKWAEHPLIG